MRLFTVLLTFLLTACGTANIKRDFSSDSLVNTSVVIGSITQKRSSEGHQGFSAEVSALSASYINIDTGKISRIETDPWMLGSMSKGDFENISGRGILFVIELDPGKYAFKGWHATQGSYTSVTPTNPKEFSFEVKPGKIIYIGDLEFSLIFGKNIFGIGVLAGADQSIVDSYHRDIKVMAEKYPGIDVDRITKSLMVDTSEITKESISKENQYIPAIQ